MGKNTSKIILHCVIFFISLLILVQIINHLYFNKVIEKRQIYRIENDFYLKLNEPNETSILIIGDSHAKDDANTHYINNSFNLAIGDPGGYILSYWYLRSVLEKANPRCALIEIDHSILNKRKYPEQTQIDNLWFWSKYASYKEISEATNNPLVDTYLKSKILFMGSGKLIEIYLNPRDLQVSEIYKGWTGNPANLSNVKNISEASQRYYKDLFEGDEKKPSRKGINYLLKILDLARKNNISIVLVNYPMSRDYMEILDKKGFNHAAYLESVFKELDNYTYTVLDYSRIYENKSEYFADIGHLNIGGSNIFSSRLKEELQNKTICYS